MSINLSEGMALRAGAILMIISSALYMQCALASTQYTVGGSQGWEANTDFTTWISGKKFVTGDTLVFKYTSLHSVLEVTKADYDSCQPTNAIQTHSDGNTVVTLSSPGKRYFICGTPGHCNGGMKLEVDTLAATAAAPPPRASPPRTVAPRPSPPASSTVAPASTPSSRASPPRTVAPRAPPPASVPVSAPSKVPVSSPSASPPSSSAPATAPTKATPGSPSASPTEAPASVPSTVAVNPTSSSAPAPSRLSQSAATGRYDAKSLVVMGGGAAIMVAMVVL